MITIKDAMQFAREVKIEFSKVSWPTFQEFLGSIFVVFIFVAFFLVYLGVIDLILSKMAKQVFRYGIYFA